MKLDEIIVSCISMISGGWGDMYSTYLIKHGVQGSAVVDPEGVQGVHSNHPLRPNYFIFMGNFREKNKQNQENEPPFVNLNPLSRNPGSTLVSGVQKIIVIIHNLFTGRRNDSTVD